MIGLAGSIGAGKSTVASILAEAGCVVSDSDRLAREVLADPACAAELASWWGPSVLDASGGVDRAAVAGIVFARPEERTRLERLVHPRIHERRASAFAAAPPGTPALVIDAPLLFEVGLDRECDRTILVDAPRELRLARVRSSRGWDDAELRRREESQWPLDRKRRAAHHVLVNDADLASLRTRVLDLLRRIHAERQVAP